MRIAESPRKIGSLIDRISEGFRNTPSGAPRKRPRSTHPAVDRILDRTFTGLWPTLVARWRVCRAERLSATSPASVQGDRPSGRLVAAGLELEQRRPIRANFEGGVSRRRAWPYFDPHYFRKALALLGGQKCKAPEGQQLWAGGNHALICRPGPRCRPSRAEILGK